ncbi:MAG: hypothetical protein KJO31_15065 [Gammaproteobacteria bacterium]|nr:hypothetical protein [Gammaproteobacteria bacterium]
MRLTAGIRCALVTILLAGCVSVPEAESRLDSSGLTIVALADAIVLARPVRTLAAAARDYAYVGPVEINRMGRREYLLWIGLASTVDREMLGVQLPDATGLVLIVDGEPMALSLAAWNTRLDHPPYDATAPIYAVVAATTSLDQIARIAAADSVELHLIAEDNVTAHYRPWQGTWASWSAFLNEQ